MINKEEILNKYEEFASFLSSINIDMMKENMTRKELNELKDSLSEVNLRSLPYEIGTIVDEMKVKEYPQLSGVHNYPELIEIDFLTEKKKIELDKYLSMMRKGSYVYNLWRFTNEEEKLKETLVEKGVLQKVYFVTCPHHHAKKKLTQIDKVKLEELKKAKENNDREILETFFEELYCNDCEDTVSYLKWNHNNIVTEYILIKERDTSLDNV